MNSVAAMSSARTALALTLVSEKLPPTPRAPAFGMAAAAVGARVVLGMALMAAMQGAVQQEELPRMMHGAQLPPRSTLAPLSVGSADCLQSGPGGPQCLFLQSQTCAFSL